MVIRGKHYLKKMFPSKTKNLKTRDIRLERVGVINLILLNISLTVLFFFKLKLGSLVLNSFENGVSLIVF